MKCMFCDNETINMMCCEDHALETKNQTYLICKQCNSIISIQNFNQETIQYALSCERCDKGIYHNDTNQINRTT